MIENGPWLLYVALLFLALAWAFVRDREIKRLVGVVKAGRHKTLDAAEKAHQKMKAAIAEIKDTLGAPSTTTEPPKKLNELKVRLRGGNHLSWTVPYTKRSGLIRPWRNFYKWWYCRDSKSFTMKCNNKGDPMHQTFLRDTVFGFSVTVIDETPLWAIDTKEKQT